MGSGEKCANCDTGWRKHCKTCSACPGDHAGWCPKEPGNVEHAKRQKAIR